MGNVPCRLYVNFCESGVLKKIVDELNTLNCMWTIVCVCYDGVYCVFQGSRPTQDVEGAVGREDSHLVPGAQRHAEVGVLPPSFPSVPSSLSAPATVSYQQPALFTFHPPPVSLISSLHSPPISTVVFSCVVGVFLLLCFCWFLCHFP